MKKNNSTFLLVFLILYALPSLRAMNTDEIRENELDCPTVSAMNEPNSNLAKKLITQGILAKISWSKPEEIAHYLTLEFDPHYQDKWDETLLLKVSGRKDCLEACKELIKKGSDVNVAEKFGITPLIRAAGKGNDQICALFLEFGADPFAQMITGETAIAMAGTEMHRRYRFPALDLRHGLHGKEEFRKIALKKERYQKTWRLLFDCYKTRAHATLTLLACLKYDPNQSGNKLYGFRKDLLRPYLEEFSLKAMRKHVAEHGKKRLGHFEISWVESFG